MRRSAEAAGMGDTTWQIVQVEDKLSDLVKYFLAMSTVFPSLVWAVTVECADLREQWE